METLTKYTKTFFAVILGVFLSSCTYFYVAHRMATLPSIHEIQDFNNVSNDLPSEEQRAVKKSRNTIGLRFLSLLILSSNFSNIQR